MIFQSLLCTRILSAVLVMLLCFCHDANGESAIINAIEYASLQDAADAIPASGGILHIPPGDFEIRQPLRIRSGDTRIRGSGTATNLINLNTEGLPTLIIENPNFAGRSTPRQERLWRVSLVDFRVTGNPQSGAGIEARFIEELEVRGVSISHHGGDGLRLDHCYEDPRISNSLFTYNKKCGVYLEGCHDIIVSANQFEENQVGLRCVDSFNLTMNGNNIDDHLGEGVVVENTYGSVITGNMIEECQGWGLVLDRDCYGITVSANVIAHNFAGGIDLRDAHGCAISANTFTIVKNASLAVRSASASIAIGGNNFSDSWIGNDFQGRPQQKRKEAATQLESNPNEASGILLDDCDHVAITGNVFSRLATPAIKTVGQCDQIIESGNVIVSR